MTTTPALYQLIQSRTSGDVWALHPHTMTCDGPLPHRDAEPLRDGTASLAACAYDATADAWMLDEAQVRVLREERVSAAPINYSVLVTTDLSRPSRQLAPHQVSLGETTEPVTGALSSGNTVFNDRAHAAGVFATLTEALEAIHRAVSAPFSVWRSDTGAYTIRRVAARADARCWDQRRIATVRADRGVQLHEDR